ncbi:MAG: TatD family hydrolase [Candidatus Micrarchaeia archaeon]
MIDAHCHLDHVDFDSDRKEAVQRARDAGVKAVINAGNNPADNRKVLALREEFGPSFFKCVLSLSPHYAPGAGEGVLEGELRFIEANRAKIVGIGETGLDYFHFAKEREREAQKKAFESFLQLAETLDLPVVIHSRDAEAACLEILGRYKCRVMLHCFLKPAFLETAVARGYAVSLPTLKSKARVKIAKKAPLGRIFCETDSPFLWREGRNEPAHVRESYEAVAEARKTGFAAAEEQIDAGVASFFNL